MQELAQNSDIKLKLRHAAAKHLAQQGYRDEAAKVLRELVNSSEDIWGKLEVLDTLKDIGFADEAERRKNELLKDMLNNVPGSEWVSKTWESLKKYFAKESQLDE